METRAWYPVSVLCFPRRRTASASGCSSALSWGDSAWKCRVSIGASADWRRSTVQTAGGNSLQERQWNYRCRTELGQILFPISSFQQRLFFRTQFKQPYGWSLFNSNQLCWPRTVCSDIEGSWHRLWVAAFTHFCQQTYGKMQKYMYLHKA